MILFGSSLFLLYALPSRGAGSGAQLRWVRRILAWGAGALAFAAGVGLLAQTCVLAGSIEEGLKPDSLSAVMTSMALGPSALVRISTGLIGLIAIAVFRPGRPLFAFLATLGAIACASFPWMGHGAATEGAGHELHLAADILHTLAAAVWIGALVMFLGLLLPRKPDVALDKITQRALHGFAGVGSILVAVLIASGLVNSWFLIGPSRLQGLWTTPYGELLSLKLILFVVMIGLAGMNRFRLTPALAVALGDGKSSSAALRALRGSLLLETTLAFVVLGLVAWLGTLVPVSAQ